MTSSVVRKDALAWQVLDLLIRRPVLTTAAVAEEFAVSAETARNALDRLEAAVAGRRAPG